MQESLVASKSKIQPQIMKLGSSYEAKCGICYQPFDGGQHRPMKICRNVHAMCDKCWNQTKALAYKDDKQARCPWCREKLCFGQNLPYGELLVSMKIFNAMIVMEQCQSTMKFAEDKVKNQDTELLPQIVAREIALKNDTIQRLKAQKQQIENQKKRIFSLKEQHSRKQGQLQIQYCRLQTEFQDQKRKFRIKQKQLSQEVQRWKQKTITTETQYDRYKKEIQNPDYICQNIAQETTQHKNPIKELVDLLQAERQKPHNLQKEIQALKDEKENLEIYNKLLDLFTNQTKKIVRTNSELMVHLQQLFKEVQRWNVNALEVKAQYKEYIQKNCVIDEQLLKMITQLQSQNNCLRSQIIVLKADRQQYNWFLNWKQKNIDEEAKSGSSEENKEQKEEKPRSLKFEW